MPGYSAEKRKRKRVKPVVKKCSPFSFAVEGQAVYAADKYV